MKILVTGVAGQLGYDVVRQLGLRGIEHKGVDLADFDLTDRRAVAEYICSYRPTHVVHCAAYTAVDKAESDRTLCTRVNVEGTRNVAAACAQIGAEMMYFSTDYVFDGFSKETPWEVNDRKDPQNHYGMTKYQGELAVVELLERYYIVRISWVFGKNGNNFVKTMLRLAENQNEINVVCDQFGAPTYTYDVAALVCDLLESGKCGVYHAPNSGVCSWYEFAQKIFEATGKKIKVNPIPTSAYPAPAARPKNSRLSVVSLTQAGFAPLPTYDDALIRYLEELGALAE